METSFVEVDVTRNSLQFVDIIDVQNEIVVIICVILLQSHLCLNTVYIGKHVALGTYITRLFDLHRVKLNQ